MNDRASSRASTTPAARRWRRPGSTRSPIRRRRAPSRPAPSPATRVHPEVLEAMREVGIDLDATHAAEAHRRARARRRSCSITMGCGEQCPVVPGLRRDDWPLEDPKGKPRRARARDPRRRAGACHRLARAERDGHARDPAGRTAGPPGGAGAAIGGNAPHRWGRRTLPFVLRRGRRRPNRRQRRSRAPGRRGAASFAGGRGGCAGHGPRRRGPPPRAARCRRPRRRGSTR